MLQEKLVAYSTAKGLKDIKFDAPCITAYDNEGRLRSLFNVGQEDLDEYVDFTTMEEFEKFKGHSFYLTPKNTSTAQGYYSENAFTIAPFKSDALEWCLQKIAKFYNQTRYVMLQDSLGNVRIIVGDYEEEPILDTEDEDMTAMLDFLIMKIKHFSKTNGTEEEK